MNLKRDAQLVRLASGYIQQPFVIGKTDCNIITLHVLELYIDLDYYSKLVNRYTTFRGGARVAKKVTGYRDIASLMKALEEAGTAQLVSKEKLSTGDIITYADDTPFSSCAIHLGNQILIANHITQKVELTHLDISQLPDVLCYRIK